MLRILKNNSFRSIKQNKFQMAFSPRKKGRQRTKEGYHHTWLVRMNGQQGRKYLAKVNLGSLLKEKRKILLPAQQRHWYEPLSDLYCTVIPCKTQWGKIQHIGRYKQRFTHSFLLPKQLQINILHYLKNDFNFNEQIHIKITFLSTNIEAIYIVIQTCKCYTEIPHSWVLFPVC